MDYIRGTGFGLLAEPEIGQVPQVSFDKSGLTSISALQITYYDSRVPSMPVPHYLRRHKGYIDPLALDRLSHIAKCSHTSDCT